MQMGIASASPITAKHCSPPSDPIDALAIEAIDCSGPEPGDEGRVLLNSSYIVRSTGEKISVQLEFEATDSQQGGGGGGSSGRSDFHGFVSYVDSKNRLLATLYSDGENTETELSERGKRKSQALRQSIAQFLYHPKVSDEFERCSAYKCGGKMHKFLNGLCIASGIVCCTAVVACPGCAIGAVACVDKSDSSCK